jgi:hypothetical protein
VDEVTGVRWTGRVARIGEIRNTCSILVGKSERERHCLGYLDYVVSFLLKMGLKEVGYERAGQDKVHCWSLVNAAMKTLISRNVASFLTS